MYPDEFFRAYTFLLPNSCSKMSWVNVWGDVTPADVLGLSPPADKNDTTPARNTFRASIYKLFLRKKLIQLINIFKCLRT